MMARTLACTVMLLAGICGPLKAEDDPRVAARTEATNAAADPTSETRATDPATAQAPVAHVRGTNFPIPFNLNQGDPTTLDVLLYVSVDRGTKWIPYSRQRATATEFPFRAGGDGEYWFASLTLLTGAPAPVNPTLSPQLKVHVDTREPRVGLNAQIDAEGRITAAWEGFDECLAPATLKLECQGGPGQAWETVAIETPPASDLETTVRGQASWTPASLDKMATVRVEVSDRAGNVGSQTRRLIVPITLAFRRVPAAAMATAAIPTDPFRSYGLPPAGATPPAGASPPTGITAVGTTVAKTGPAGDVPSSQDVADEPSEQPEPYEVAKAETSDPKAVTWPSSGQGMFGTDPEASAYPPARSPVGPHVAKNVSTSSSDGEPVDEEDGGQGSTEGTEGGETFGLPPGERPRMTQLRRFNLAYSVDAVGPGGVDKVELWMTRNGGREWELWSEDEDRETPMLVDMTNKDEGIYGFRIVIVGKNGLASQTPRAGELADLWIGIDSTPPTAEITTAAYGSGAEAGHLDIQWTVDDEFLGPRPITLKFSDDPDGEWTTIAAGLPNNGQYLWRVDSRVPDEFYLRLEARDEAGNVTTRDLDQPLKSAGMTPKGHIRTLTPADEPSDATE